jgi:DNA-binding transcriptional regulator YdaS (Cro superfamily)
MEGMMPQPAPRLYKALGDVLRDALPTDTPQKLLAELMAVSEQAVHYWISGQNRPAPDRLGSIAAILDLSPEHLAALAGYETEPVALAKVLTIYERARANNFVYRSDTLAGAPFPRR